MEVNLEACPLCGSFQNTVFLETKDFLLTGETFRIMKCNSCTFLFTNPRPSHPTLEKYYQSHDYISHSKENYRLKNLIYYAARYVMMHKKYNWIKDLCDSPTGLLDYGCGTGSFLDFLLHKNWEVWGVEPNENARKHISKNLNDRVYSQISELPNLEFTFITLWHVLEHLDDIHGTIETLWSKLSFPGWLMLAVPNHNSYDAQYYQAYWAGYDLPRHLSHFTPVTMKLLAKKHRLQLVKTIPLKLDAYYISMLSEQYRGGSLFKAIYQAFKSNRYAAVNHSNYSSLVYILKK